MLVNSLLPNPGIEPRSPALQAGSLPSEPPGKPIMLKWVAVPFSWGSSQPAEPPGKPKNTGVGNLSLLQQIFPTQESNQDLLHCRWILYQLSYQGSLMYAKSAFYYMQSIFQERLFLNLGKNWDELTILCFTVNNTFFISIWKYTLFLSYVFLVRALASLTIICLQPPVYNPH